MSPLDVPCLPSTARLDLLVAGMLRLRPSTRRRIVDDHRLVALGRDRLLWRGESLAQRAVADALAAARLDSHDARLQRRVWGYLKGRRESGPALFSAGPSRIRAFGAGICEVSQS